MHFSKTSGRLSTAGPEVLAFGSHCSAKIQPVSDCLKSNFKLQYEDSENIKPDCADTVLFKLHQIKQRNFFWGHPVLYSRIIINSDPTFEINMANYTKIPNLRVARYER